MLRTAAVVVGAVCFVAGVGACGVPGTVASQPSALPSVVVATSPSAVDSAPGESAPVASTPAASAPATLPSSPMASVPAVTKPLKPVGSPPADVGDLQEFAQVSATRWWATVVGNLSDRLYLVRSVDAGRHWQDVTPSVTELHANAGVSSYALSADVAWLDVDAEPTTAQLFRTLDGGQSWQDIGTVPSGCALQFIDVSNGWCYTLQGALGSMGVELYRTQDGGVSWQLISRTTGDGTPETVDGLPFGCDKQLTFTSDNVVWASSFCAGGNPYLETSTDGGAHWHAVTPPPFPAWAAPPEGEGLSVPAVDGKDVAIVDLGGLGPGGGAIDTSSDGGRSWRVHPLPTASSGQYWYVDLVDPTHWRATDGDVILSTDDAGAHWRRWTPAISMHDQYGTLELNFISPEIGSASDPSDRTPLWSTTDGGMTWTKVVIDAGPYVLK
jgi:photosystem II stability/assembly factor-like uncharacterized protein